MLGYDYRSYFSAILEYLQSIESFQHYILYVLVFFFFVWLAFQFLHKRWLDL